MLKREKKKSISFWRCIGLWNWRQAVRSLAPALFNAYLWRRD